MKLSPDLFRITSGLYSRTHHRAAILVDMIANLLRQTSHEVVAGNRDHFVGSAARR
jgi:hypothetical protein